MDEEKELEEVVEEETIDEVQEKSEEEEVNSTQGELTEPVIEIDENEFSNLGEVMKKSALTNPDLTFCEKTTYLDFLLSNAQTEEEQEEIKQVVDNYLEISKEQPAETEEE